MPTDTERREVAQRLREIFPYYNSPGTIPKLMQKPAAEYLTDLARALGYSPKNDVSRIDFQNHLADLIEPETERTCRMVSAFDTDELEGIQENISFSPEDTLAYMCEGCGFDFRYERGLYPRYCPNCGARVKEDDDGNE